MSEDPVKAIDETVYRIDEAVGLEKGPFGGWLKRAPMDEVMNWLVNNIKVRLVSARRLVADVGGLDTLEDFYVIDMGGGEKEVSRSRLRVFTGTHHPPLTRRDLYRGRMPEAECEYAHAFMCGGFPNEHDPDRPSKDDWLDQKPYDFEVDKFVSDMLFGEGSGEVAILRREIDRLRKENESLRKAPAVKRNCDRFNSGDPEKDADDALHAYLAEGVAGFREVARYLLSPIKEKTCTHVADATI